jgi:hypothetical protein
VINSLSPACPTYVIQQYQWNGSLFVSTPLQYEITPLNEISQYCEVVLETASDLWGPEPTIKVAQAMLEIWPPEKKINGKPYPPDALDELRYHLGVLYALAGQTSEARSTLNEITTSPITPDSTWISPAREFLNAYQGHDDLFSACLQAQQCNYRDALHTLVATSSLDTTDQVLTYLQEHGVTIRSKGVFDFDLDGQDERWVIIRPRIGSKLEFWILSKVLEGVRATFVQVLDAAESSPYYHEPSGAIPVVQFELHRGFIFTRLKDTLEPYIDWVDVEYARPTMILDGYNQAVNALMAGEDPKSIQNILLELLNSPRYKGDCIAFKICDQFHYTLGFVFDINGEEGNAIDQYLWVWRNYIQSSFANLARLKLDYFPLPTYTRTPIPSITPTRTRTPSSATPTLTKTVTPTFSPSPTATSTFTETTTPTATEMITPSPTP